MKTLLSPKEYKIWNFYIDYIEENGIPPKISKVASEFNTSRQYIDYANTAMKKKEYMIKLPVPKGRKRLHRSWIPSRLEPQARGYIINYIKHLKKDYYKED